MFLFVQDVVLGASNDTGTLNALYRLTNSNTGQSWVWRVALDIDQYKTLNNTKLVISIRTYLPVPTSLRVSANGSNDWSELDINTLELVLCSHINSLLSHDLAVP